MSQQGMILRSGKVVPRPEEESPSTPRPPHPNPPTQQVAEQVMHISPHNPALTSFLQSPAVSSNPEVHATVLEITRVGHEAQEQAKSALEQVGAYQEQVEHMRRVIHTSESHNRDMVVRAEQELTARDKEIAEQAQQNAKLQAQCQQLNDLATSKDAELARMAEEANARIQAERHEAEALVAARLAEKDAEVARVAKENDERIAIEKLRAEQEAAAKIREREIEFNRQSEEAANRLAESEARRTAELQTLKEEVASELQREQRKLATREQELNHLREEMEHRVTRTKLQGSTALEELRARITNERRADVAKRDRRLAEQEAELEQVRREREAASQANDYNGEHVKTLQREQARLEQKMRDMETSAQQARENHLEQIAILQTSMDQQEAEKWQVLQEKQQKENECQQLRDMQASLVQQTEAQQAQVLQMVDERMKAMINQSLNVPRAPPGFTPIPGDEAMSVEPPAQCAQRTAQWARSAKTTSSVKTVMIDEVRGRVDDLGEQLSEVQLKFQRMEENIQRGQKELKEEIAEQVQVGQNQLTTLMNKLSDQLSKPTEHREAQRPSPTPLQTVEQDATLAYMHAQQPQVLPPPPGFPAQPQFAPPTRTPMYDYSALRVPIVEPNTSREQQRQNLLPHTIQLQNNVPTALPTNLAPAFIPNLDLASIPGRAPSTSSKRITNVDPKSWPKFDGTGSFESFMIKTEVFMENSAMDEEERIQKMLEIVKGRAFTWLCSQPDWRSENFDGLVRLLRKEYGGSQTKDIARLNNLKCTGDLNKFNDEFNKIGQGCRQILPESAQKYTYVRLVKPDGLRKHLQTVSGQVSLQQLQSIAVEMEDLFQPNHNSSGWSNDRNRNFPNTFNRDGGKRVLCKKCGFWHGEKDRCRTATPDKGRPDNNNNKRFEPRNRNGPRVNEGELPTSEVEDTAVEEVDGQSTDGSEGSGSHF